MEEQQANQKTQARRHPDWPVLSGRLPADELPGTARYSEDCWRLAPAERLGHAMSPSLNFLLVPDEFRGVAKELFAQLLDDDYAPRGTPYMVSTVAQYFTGVKSFLNFLHGKRLARIALATPTIYAEYVGYLSARGSNLAAHLRAARLLWTYRRCLSDAMSSDPATVAFWIGHDARRPSENRTARIPEQVLNPLVWWSTMFVNEFAGDILSAREEYRRLSTPDQERRLAEPRERPRGALVGRVRALLDEYEASGRPLPSHHTDRVGSLNLRALDREAGVPTGTTWRSLYARAAALAARNGLDFGTYLSTPVSGRVLERPWKERIAFGEVPTLTKHLQTACWILIAFFSGMRDSEVKHIERGCIAHDDDDTGRLRRVILTGVTFKGVRSSKGRRVRWVVAPIVEDAVKVLEELADADQMKLFTPLREGTSHNLRVAHPLVNTNETLRALESFQRWILSFVGEGSLLPAPPCPQGAVYHLTTRQFRRTLAWFIARRPGGIAAGALQYKHLSLQMFRGYAGESDSDFPEDLAAEQALARGEWLGEFAAEVDSVVGRAKDEVVRRLDQLGKVLGFAGALPENPRQLADFLKQHDPYIYRGVLVTCVFDPSKALCIRKTPGEPDFQTCEPLTCSNAIFTPEDIAAWRDRARGLLEISEDGTLAPRVRASARDHATRLLGFFDTLEAKHG